MRNHYPEALVAAWKGAEKGKMKRLIESYGEQATIEGLKYLVTQWDRVKDRLSWVKGDIPSLNLYAKFHEMIVNDARSWGEVAGVLEEYEAWEENNPYSAMPRELEEKYEKVRPKLESMGLVKKAS